MTRINNNKQVTMDVTRNIPKSNGIKNIKLTFKINNYKTSTYVMNGYYVGNLSTLIRRQLDLTDSCNERLQDF